MTFWTRITQKMFPVTDFISLYYTYFLTSGESGIHHEFIVFEARVTRRGGLVKRYFQTSFDVTFYDITQ